MSEAGRGGYVDEQAPRRVPGPPPGRRPRHRHGSPEEHLPRPGMEVAGYRLERRLGSGGQGTVFRARREGRLFAVKFIYLPHSAPWAWRELDVRVKLWRAGGPLLEGHGLWPAREPLFLFLVTPFVRGLPLDVWTRVHNPTAREVAELVRQAARLLRGVHAAGVVHRDVKGANLLVDGERRLVLVDFGVATYEGAPAATGPFPPGTWPYLSPRVWRAWRGEEASRACPGDDVWALGVELYQLLTGRLPFQGREGELVQAILHAEPEPPHEANPRVPRALGELCQRMLRKKSEERFADARAFEEALEEALKQADAAWEEPLCEAWGPRDVTTEQQEGQCLTGGEFEALHERLASYERRHVRGRPLPPDEVSTLGSPGEAPPGHDSGEPSVTSAEATKEAVPPARSRGVRWWAAGAVLLLSGLCVGLALGRMPRASEPTPSPMETPRVTLPVEFYPVTLEPGVQEVAPPRKPPEGDGGAAPRAATTPAPVARATPAQDTRVKTPAKATATPQKPIDTNRPARTLGALVLTCTLATGCPGPTTTAQVRPTPLPPPAECPEGAAQAMKELGLLRRPGAGHVWFGSGLEFGAVRPGPVTMRLSAQAYWGQLPEGTLFTGEVLFFGGRVQGRFTQAQTPDGHTYPVCLELQSGPEWGWEKLEGSTQDSARVINGANLYPVDRFGEAWRYNEDKHKQ